MNKILLIGRMTRDPEFRTTQNDKAVATFSLAVDDGFGENKKTYFFNVTVWGKAAVAVSSYTHKGSKVAVTGKLTSRSYEDKNGNKRTAVEVVTDMLGGVDFLDSKQDSKGSGGYSYQSGGQDLGEEQIPF